LRYLIAVLAMGIAVGARLALNPLVGEGAVAYITLFPTLVFVGWYAGPGPALVSLLLGGLAADYFILPPAFEFAIDDSHVRAGLGIYLIMGAGCAALGHAFRRARERAGAQAELALGRQQQLESEAAERSRTEAALRESEERFRLMANTTPAMIWTADPTGAITFHNQRWLDYTGITPEENTREWPAHILHPDDRERCAQAWTEALREGTDYEIEVRNRRHDGAYRWFLTRATPIRDTEGRIVAWFGSTTDIHDRKMAEMELRHRGEQFETLLNQAPIGVYLVDAEFRLRQVNPVALPVFGDIPGGVIGRDFDEIMHILWEKAYADEIVRTFRHTLETGEPYIAPERAEFRVDRGTTEYYEWRLDRILLPDGRYGLVCYFRDISQQVQARQALGAAGDVFRHLVENSPFGVYAVDADFRLVQVSAGAQKVFENVRPLLGRDFAEVLRIVWPEPFASEAIGRFRHTLETGEPYHSPSTVERRHDIGEVESYDWKIERVTLPDGRFGVVCHFYDLSERQQYEEALREADRRKDEFLAMLAHELRNPLAPILNAVRIQEMLDPADPRLPGQRAVIKRQAEQMKHLLDDLLDVSRITRGKIELRPERLDLATVVSEAVEASRPLIQEREHQLQVTLPPRTVWLEADRIRLAQVFTNLLNNAAKYTDTGGRIALTAELENSHLLVRVRDTGIGMSPDVLAHVFDLFAQADRSLDRSQGGLGIGLTIVRRLVEMHGGTVSAHSAGPGKGSEFAVRLPAQTFEHEVDAPGRTEAPREGTRLGARRILVVDDNADMAETLSELLEMEGHEVFQAHDGPEAVAAARAHRPEVVLLDIGLPGKDGYQVAQELRRVPELRHAVLVAITGYGQEPDRRRSQEAGFEHHLVKPIDFAALQAVLSSRSGRPQDGDLMLSAR
jgi:PAS domain S-box-containing protein